MKDEIKEIINQLEIVARKHTIEVCEGGSKIETMPASIVDELRLNNYSSKLLLDYITSLQDTLIDKQECINAYDEIIKHRDKEITDLQKEMLEILKGEDNE